MLVFFIDNLFVHCDGRVFKKTAFQWEQIDLFLHSYEADLIADLIQKKKYRLARSFNLSFRYIAYYR